MGCCSMGFFSHSTTQEPEEKRDLGIEQLFKNTSLDLEKHVVNLRKETGIDLDKHLAQVFGIYDISGSMNKPFKNGQMQRVTTKFFTIGVRFDDNKKMEILVFNDETKKIKSMSLKNYMDFVQKHMVRKGYSPFGGTRYVPAIETAIDIYTNKKCSLPAFGVFLTDGAANEKTEALDIAFKKLYETKKIFLASIGFWTDYTTKKDFEYLRNLNKKFNNTNFMEVTDFERMSNDQLFSGILKGYPEWLRRNNYI